MSSLSTGGRRGASGTLALVVVVVLIGANLRGPITGVPPLLGDIRADLGLTPAASALVTTLPLLAFALLSPLVAPLAQRLGLDRTLLLSIVLLAVAILTRPWLGAGVFLVGTALLGVAITIGNVLLPVVIRRDAPERIPTVMAASTASYGIGQGIAAFAAVPVALLVGWRWSISLPVVLTVVALIAWVLYAKRQPAQVQEVAPRAASSTREWAQVFTLPEAWWVAVFFGIQAMLFYTATTWIPDQLVDTAGVSKVAAGNALSVFHLTGIAGSLLVPLLLKLTGNAKRLGVVLGLVWMVFFIALLALPGWWPVWMVLGGIVQGAGISLGLILTAVRPISVGFGRYVSGMVQGVGYLIAALGPLLVGWLFQRAGSWVVSTVVLAALGAAMALVALRAGAEEKIGPEPLVRAEE